MAQKMKAEVARGPACAATWPHGPAQLAILLTLGERWWMGLTVNDEQAFVECMGEGITGYWIVSLKGITADEKKSNFLCSLSFWTIFPNFISVSKFGYKLEMFQCYIFTTKHHFLSTKLLEKISKIRKCHLMY